MAKQNRADLRAQLTGKKTDAQGATQDAAPAQQPAAQGPIYQLSTTVRSAELPPEALALGEQLYEIARRYVGARRRSGEALLEAARWLSEARRIAEEGSWYLFLQVTGTNRDVAERLLNIHLLAARRPDFESAVIQGRLNQSVAALLARPSTPHSALDAILAEAEPVSVATAQRLIRATRQGHLAVENVDNPLIAGSQELLARATASPLGVGERAAITQVTALLQRVAAGGQPLADADLALLAPLIDALQQILERSAGTSQGAP
jgi:hypothetical protein